MWPNWQETANLVTFTEEILNGKFFAQPKYASVNFIFKAFESSMKKCLSLRNRGQTNSTREAIKLNKTLNNWITLDKTEDFLVNVNKSVDLGRFVHIQQRNP